MINQLSLKSFSKKRKYFKPVREFLEIPNLIEVQKNSFNWFIENGIKELLEEISPIATSNFELYFLDYQVEEPKFDEETARKKNANYEAPLRVKIKLVNKITGEEQIQEIFFGEIPLMTKRGSFIINGNERCVVNQLIRSSGVFFTSENIGGRLYYGAKIIPYRGAWLEFETNAQNVIYLRIDRGRKILVTTFLRALGYSTNEEIKKLFEDVNTDKERDYIEETLSKDPARNEEEGLIEVYKKLRPGELATPDNCRSLIFTKLFNFRHYDLGKVGRYKINQRLGLNFSYSKEHRVLQKEDIIETIKEIIRLNNGLGVADDIDHLGNRRVRSVGELLHNRFRAGLLRVERIIRDRMTVLDPQTLTPSQLINIKPLVASLQEFFTTSPLSQFMDETNPLSSLVHKRRVTATGPGGLTRERAGFEVRDVHPSHYGRICPIETPEGQNIGLVNSLACYAKINEFGFIETPFRKVIKEVENNPKKLVGRLLREDIIDPKTKKKIAGAGERIDEKLAEKIAKVNIKSIKVKPFVSDEVEYLDAIKSERVAVAHGNTKLNEYNEFAEEHIVVRKFGEPYLESEDNIEYMDVAPWQIGGITASLIPFLEHDEGTRAQMGANMMRQAVPLITPEAPLVGTGLEEKVAKDAGQVLISDVDGTVEEATASEIKIKTSSGETKIYKLINFNRTNQGTCFHQYPRVKSGEKVKKGDILADSYSSENGELALGKNVLIAFMPWRGGNFEDAIIISSRLVKEDVYTSIHIESYSIEVRDTKLGPEIVTRDIPNVGEEALKNLDERGIVRIGAEVKAGDILVGKITPKGETELTAEERLLRAIFGEKARDVKDTSLRLPHGERGKVIDVRIFSKEKGDKLEVGVLQKIEVFVAQMRKITIGDKLAGRHGNKGVISTILPEEDMPYLPDGRPVDIILNPLGVISRLNIGQVLETHLGLAAKALGYKVASPIFFGPSFDEIKEELKKAGFPEDGKVQLYDGRTGEPFDYKTTIGYMYIMKLIHMVEDKAHARSVGPYSLITQQPLGGKAQFGGQRFGEMEVWALEAYGAAYTLQEMLTIKSDDVFGRTEAYKSIIKGEPIKEPQIPTSFNVLLKELQGLGLSIEMIKEEDKENKDIREE